MTERLVLMDIDYALSSLSADAEICWAVREIQRCCKKVEGEEKEKEKNRMKAAETETDSKGEDHDRDESVCGDMGTDMQIDMDMEEYHTPWIGRFGDEELRW